MKIYAIIVTYNGVKWLDKCIPSLINSSLIEKIIVIDNLSSDGTCEHILAHYPEVLLIENEYNQGFGQANNKGIKIALEEEADYALLINQDAWILKNTIEEFVKVLDYESILSPIHLDGNGIKLDFNFKLYIKDSLNNNTLLDDLIVNRNPNNLYEVSFVNAACWFVPINAFKKIGGFNPIFHHYGEDLDFYNKSKYHGIKFYLATNAKISHDRLQFGNKQAFSSKLILRTLLIYYSDINIPFISCNKEKVRLHLRSIIKFIMLILSLKIQEASSILKSYLIFFGMIPSILRGRKVQKTKGLQWL